MSFLTKFTQHASKGKPQRVEAELPSLGKKTKGHPSAQLILDRIPKHMQMQNGDEYFIPPSIATARIDIEWARAGRVPVEVECMLVLLDVDFRRCDYVTPQRRVSRDKAVAVINDDVPMAPHGRRETFTVKLKTLGADVAHLLLVITIKSLSKTLADIVGPSISLSDMGYYPGSPELLRYTLDAEEERFYPGAVLLMISLERSVSQTKSFTVRALESPLMGRAFRQISDDIESIAHSVYHEESSGVSHGGDFRRVISEEMAAKALYLTSGGELRRRDVNCEEDDDDDAETCTSSCSGESDSDSLRLFYVQNGVSSFKPPDGSDKSFRPVVVRKGKRNYTAGKAHAQGRGSETESDSNGDDDAFRLTFPKYADSAVTRYGRRVYNMGSDPVELYGHYLESKSSMGPDVIVGSPLEVGLTSNRVEYGEVTQATVLKPPLPTVMQEMVVRQANPALVSDHAAGRPSNGPRLGPTRPAKRLALASPRKRYF